MERASLRISTVAFVGVLLLMSAQDAAAQLTRSVAPQRVVVPSGTLRLTALLWTPTGSGPFPAVLFNHGGNRTESEKAQALGPVFAKHGYVFLYLFRRGYGLSADQGEFMRDILDREAQARGEEARKRLQLRLLTTDHLDDVMAGLGFLKRVANVDSGRVVVGGHSTGGQLTLLALERDKSVRAAVAFSPAAQTWEGSPELQNRLLAAARHIETPIFLTHPANDFSIVPGQKLSAELTRLKRPHELKIYPAVGDTPAAGHQAVYTDIATWEPDVFRFLDTYLRPPSLSAGQRRETVRAGPARLRVTMKGRGEPVVFIPSRGRGVDDFDDLSTRLVQAGYQVILPEPRGIGGSTGPLEGITYHDLASDAAAVIQSVARAPVTIIAHAFGTRIARTLASDHPDRVKQLILLAAAGVVPRSATTEATTTRFWETPLSPADRLDAIRQVFFAPGNDPHVWADGWHFDVAQAQRASDARTPLKDWWAGGSAPMLILQGSDDVIVLPENAKRLAAEFPRRVTLVEIAHAGHALLPEQPDAIAKAVLAWLRR
jgi:pimeloyl-ACP methyl ester carboxylesterase